jgi:hypothetical protein
VRDATQSYLGPPQKTELFRIVIWVTFSVRTIITAFREGRNRTSVNTGEEKSRTEQNR